MNHSDHLGTPQKMTDASGTVVWAADYKPFGETVSITGSATNNLRFTGQYFDQETGLHYNYFREYNSIIGRYVESDPMGIPDRRIGSRQRTCSPGCRKQLKKENNRRFSRMNPAYWCGRYDVVRVWRNAHPGYQSAGSGVTS
jgi:RHS repeat-associated protein